MAISPLKFVLTSPLLPTSSPTLRRLISNSLDGTTIDIESHNTTIDKFTVLSYNVLADLFVKSDKYSYCPPHALLWTYRGKNILREVLQYSADIICLQEVQNNHFDEFFAPEFEKHGYDSVYKTKIRNVFTSAGYTTDGCAIFFKRKKFSLVQYSHLDFLNDDVISEFIGTIASKESQNEAAHRLLKDNVALAVILEFRNIVHAGCAGSLRKGQRLCVMNAHIQSNPRLTDVKLWQVLSLLKELEHIDAMFPNIPIVIGGDFNCVPGSAPHALLTTGHVDARHQELRIDPYGILQPSSKLCHRLPLVSAYETDNTKSPFTICTDKFLGTLDYIFYSVDSLEVMSLLELLDEDQLRKNTALPSIEWSSDHLALLAEFRFQ